MQIRARRPTGEDSLAVVGSTAEDGLVRWVPPDAGPYTLLLRRIGYRALNLELTVPTDSAVIGQVVMAYDAVTIPPYECWTPLISTPSRAP